MASVNATYAVGVDAWTFTYDPLGIPFDPEGDTLIFSNDDLPPDGPWSALITVFDLSTNAGFGLLFMLEDGTTLNFLVHQAPQTNLTNIWMAPYTSGQMTLRADWDGAVLDFFYAVEGDPTWRYTGSYTPAAGVTVHDLGLILRYDDESSSAIARATAARLLPGGLDDGIEEISVESPSPLSRTLLAPAPFSADEPMIHVIVGAPFGDLENDIGKSVRWIEWFSDNTFILDVNLGDPRYWIVNWAMTFPDARHGISGTNFFVRPAQFRKEQWEGFLNAFGSPDDEAWIYFMDGTEGFSVDNRSLPDDYAFAPFQSFFWREVQRANLAGQTSVVLPHFAFLRSDDIINVSYEASGNVNPESPDYVPPVLQAVSTPYYLPYQGMRRLWRADQLKKPNFDWSQLDTWQTPSANVKVQIISYAYAHWHLQDIVPPANTVPPLSEANDDGWRMRNLISKVRPIPSLPYGEVWQPPSADLAGTAGPWPIATTMVTHPDLQLEDKNGDPLVPPTPSAVTAGICTPLYDTVFRLNMRDGVWYEVDPFGGGESGNIPLRWDEARQDWVTDYNPQLWPDKGVKAAL